MHHLVAATLILIALVVLVGIAIVLFEIKMFIDVIKNPNLSDIERIVWLAGMLLIHPFVAIAYYFISRNNRNTI